MSAIAAAWRRDGRATDDLMTMLDAMAPWGRDGRREWHAEDGNVALGQLLRIDTPRSREATGPLPAAGGLVVAADARLDEGLGTDTPDDERMAAILAAGPDAAVKRLCDTGGAFAAVAWDAARQRLLLVRDHFGQRPLFWTRRGDRIAVATDIVALLALDWVEEVADAHYRDALRLGVIGYLPSRSPFVGIQRVPTAHIIAIGDGGWRPWRYWDPADDVGEHPGTLEEQVADLRQGIEDAVLRCLDTVHPVGAHISGGLDSSAYAVLAARELRRRGDRLVAGFSWSPPYDQMPLIESTGDGSFGDVDERPRVEQIGKAEDIPIVFTSLPDDAVERHLTRVPGLEPTTSSMYEIEVVENAVSRGVRVLLSGWGSDELPAFNGRGHPAHLARTGRWRELGRLAAARAQAHGAPSIGWITMAVLGPSVPHIIWRRLPWPNSPQDIGDGVDPSLIMAADRTRRAQTSVRRAQLALLRRGHLEARLAAWCLLEREHGVSYAYPALGLDLVRSSLSLAPRATLHNGWKRWAFRQATAGVLAAPVRWNAHKDDVALATQHLRDPGIGRPLR